METLTLKQLTELLTTKSTAFTKKDNKILNSIKASAILMFSDLFIVCACIFCSLYLKDMMLGGRTDYTSYFYVIPFVSALVATVFAARNLYPGFGFDVVDELRRTTTGITIVFAVILTLSFMLKGGFVYSRFAYTICWLFSIIAVPLGRGAVRKMFGSKKWWGIPVFIIGAGKAGEQLIKSLKRNNQIGLRPIVAIDDDVDKWGYIKGVPVIGGLHVIPELQAKLSVDYAIVAMPTVPSKRQHKLIKKYSNYFTHLTVIPELFGNSSLWVSTKDLGGVLGLEVQNKLTKQSSFFVKRIFDIFFGLLYGLIALPLIAIISFIIKMSSKGRVFFKQERMGRSDSRFQILKFRTMHVDADKRLGELLESNIDLKKEFEFNHKLKDDPRLTKIGKLLRKYSLDELPQFWNVLKGEMSLIGPRAYMAWEKVKMNGNDDFVLKVIPGITGLWQVTDREDSSFEERVEIDIYYIRNWSIYLDFYIMAKTIGVMLKGKNT